MIQAFLQMTLFAVIIGLFIGILIFLIGLPFTLFAKLKPKNDQETTSEHAELTEEVRERIITANKEFEETVKKYKLTSPEIKVKVLNEILESHDLRFDPNTNKFVDLKEVN